MKGPSSQLKALDVDPMLFVVGIRYYQYSQEGSIRMEASWQNKIQDRQCFIIAYNSIHYA